MIPIQSGDSLYRQCIPRESGDDPTLPFRVKGLSWYSPRERG